MKNKILRLIIMMYYDNIAVRISKISLVFIFFYVRSSRRRACRTHYRRADLPGPGLPEFLGQLLMRPGLLVPVGAYRALTVGPVGFKGVSESRVWGVGV